jgi:hypothetical protein
MKIELSELLCKVLLKVNEILQLHKTFCVLHLYICIYTHTIYICVRNGNCVRTNTFSTNVLTPPLVQAPSETRNKFHLTSLLFQVILQTNAAGLKRYTYISR